MQEMISERQLWV